MTARRAALGGTTVVGEDRKVPRSAAAGYHDRKLCRFDTTLD